jgi:hypothetical protein
MKLVQATKGGVFSCWPTPTVQMGGNRTEIAIGENGLFFLAATDQKGSQVSLRNAVQVWMRFHLLAKALGMRGGKVPETYPYSHRLHLNITYGTRSSKGEMTLNPQFMDWTMGWPIGWSDITQPVTEWSHWQQRSHTAHLKQRLIAINQESATNSVASNLVT